MGMLVDGCWTDEDRILDNGTFIRPDSRFDDAVSAAQITAMAGQPGRFHLIASLSCPWSHRTLLMHHLKGLQHMVPVQLAHGPRLQGYAVNGGRPWPVPGAGRPVRHLHQLYTMTDAGYTGRSTVPVLWDRQSQRIISNDSAAIMRAFDAVTSGPADGDITFFPHALAGEIEQLNLRLYHRLSNGVYRAGFARAQAPYDAAIEDIFAMLDELEQRLEHRRYLLGDTVTESDWRLFPTLVRFDAVYHILFRCSRRRLVDYPNLWAYGRDLYNWPGVAATVDFDVIRHASYDNDRTTNPDGIVAALPDMDWRQPNDRHKLGPARISLRNGDARIGEPGDLLSPAGLLS